MTTWIAVTSTARARFFDRPNRTAPLVEVSDLVNPENRLAPHDLKSDKPGRAFDKLGGQRHARSTPVDPKEQVARRFAKQVVDELESARQGRRFDELYLVASPHFLGLLREQMGEPLARTVRGELTKDLTKFESAALQEHVAGLL